MLNIYDAAGVRVVELNHGKVNALDLDILQAIIDAFHNAPVDRPFVLTGAGRAFCAGVDLRRIAESDRGYVRDFLAALSEAFLAVFDHRGPVVAAINGSAIAGGCVLAAACDRRVMSQGMIGLAELAVGVPFPTVALEIMRGLLGPRTPDMTLAARRLSADEALAIGLVDEVAPADELLTRAIRSAETLGGLPTGVFSFTKRQLQRPVRERIATARDADDATMESLWLSESVRSGITEYMADLHNPATDSPRRTQ